MVSGARWSREVELRGEGDRVILSTGAFPQVNLHFYFRHSGSFSLQLRWTEKALTLSKSIKKRAYQTRYFLPERCLLGATDP